MMRAVPYSLTLMLWLVSFPAAATEYKWTQVTKAAAFAERDGAGAATYNGKMWVLGGWADDPAGGSAHVGYNDVWSSTDGLNWTQVRPNTPGNPSVWEGRHCGGYAVFKNKIWIVGGDPLLKHYQNDVWSSSDGVNWEQATANAAWRLTSIRSSGPARCPQRWRRRYIRPCPPSTPSPFPPSPSNP